MFNKTESALIKVFEYIENPEQKILTSPVYFYGIVLMNNIDVERSTHFQVISITQ